ncbi:MAG TPA: methyltransferase [Candidatus Aquicultor sp.]|jgi:protein-S-isoprenylcysteine O-methyltransferase Ste14
MDTTAIAIIAIFSFYIAYLIVKSIIDKLYSEALIAMGVAVLSAQIFVVAYFAGQFLRLRMHKNLNITLESIGLVLLAVSLALLIGAFVSKRKMTSLVSLWGSTQLFMTQGVYGVIRHPIHLGGILASLGIALLMANAVIIMLGIIASAAFFAASSEEDRQAQEKIGYEYDVYMEEVPAFNLVTGISRARKTAKM